MALSQPGADYKNRAHVHNKDPLLGRALDDVMDKVQAVANQTNASVTGKASAPSAPTALSVTNNNGHATLGITHENAPAGTNYLIEYSTTKNFVPGSFVQVDNGISKSYGQYLKGQTLYFRTAARFSTSEPSSFVYFGTQNSPTPVTF
jgi:hypothetical protein